MKSPIFGAKREQNCWLWTKKEHKSKRLSCKRHKNSQKITKNCIFVGVLAKKRQTEGVARVAAANFFQLLCKFGPNGIKNGRKKPRLPFTLGCQKGLSATEIDTFGQNQRKIRKNSAEKWLLRSPIPYTVPRFGKIFGCHTLWTDPQIGKKGVFWKFFVVFCKFYEDFQHQMAKI